MADAAAEAHWNKHITVDQWGNSAFKRDTPGCRYCDALSGRAARSARPRHRPDKSSE